MNKKKKKKIWSLRIFHLENYNLFSLPLFNNSFYLFSENIEFHRIDFSIKISLNRILSFITWRPSTFNPLEHFTFIHAYV